MSRPALWQSVTGFLIACVLVFPATWLYSRIQLARDIAWVREFEPNTYRVYGSYSYVAHSKDGQPDTIFELGCRSLIDESKLKIWLPSAVESRIRPLFDEPETLTVSANSLTTGIESPPKSSNMRVFDLPRIERFGSLQQLQIGYDTTVYVGGVRPHAKPISGVDFTFLRCLPDLRVLSISGIEFNDRDARELRHLLKLQSLTIDSDGLTDEGLVALRGLKQLEELRLASRNIQGSGLAEIAGLTNLTKLDVSGITYSPGLIRHFQNLTKLQALYLHDSARPIFGDEDLKYLPHPALRALSLDSGWRLLWDRPDFDLAGTQVTDQGLKSLCGNHKIQQLDLSDSRVTNGGIQSLCCLPKLDFLSLRGLVLNDSGVRQLAALPHLEVLDVRNSTLSNSRLLVLQTRHTLRTVFAAGTVVTQPVVSRVRETLAVDFHDHGAGPPITWRTLAR